MDFEQSLKHELSTIAGLTQSVFPLRAPEHFSGAYVIYDSNGHNKLKTMDGFDDQGETLCTVDVLASTYSDMKATALAVRNKLESFPHRTIGQAGPYVQNITFEQLSPEFFEDEVNLYRKQIDFTVFF